MKNTYIISLLVLLTISISSLASAAIKVDKIDKGSVVIAELDNPAVFDFIINNPNGIDSAEIYSFLGVSFSPKGTFDIQSGENVIEVKAYPSKEVRKNSGTFKFQYEIKTGNQGIYKNSLSIKIVPLKDSLTIKSFPLNIDDKSVSLEIKNTQNTHLENIMLQFSSAFFNGELNVTLKPFEFANISIPIDTAKIQTLVAGNYIFNTKIIYDTAETNLEGTIKYLESENIVLTTESKGLIVRKKSLTKKNEGNVPLTAEIEISKDIISRLFTTHSIQPDTFERKGLMVTYKWSKSLSPSESFSVSLKTNYTLPFILLLLIIIIGVFVKLYTRTALILTKRVFFVRTKGGEFALKVRIHVKAKKKVENIQIIEKLPGGTQLYEKFGVKPDHIDSSTHRLFWNIIQLNAGEERVYSYIIYSKVRVFGRFELPQASASFERNNKKEHAFSNRAYFVSETTSSEE
ncbi:hypothetical protein HYW75_00750 [Candidatus Pacearchaeota archaeon]|nr:hypothetical protein [Candidatus Pacearchaeota archaeon]